MRLDKGSQLKAQALIEAAIALPILIMLLLGVVQFGLIVQSRQTCYAAVRQGARLMTATGNIRREHLKNFFLGPNNRAGMFRDPAKAEPRHRGSRREVTVWVDYSFPALPWMPPVMPGLTGPAEQPLDQPFHGVRIENIKCKMIGDVRG